MANQFVDLEMQLIKWREPHEGKPTFELRIHGQTTGALQLGELVEQLACIFYDRPLRYRLTSPEELALKEAETALAVARRNYNEKQGNQATDQCQRQDGPMTTRNFQKN